MDETEGGADFEEGATLVAGEAPFGRDPTSFRVSQMPLWQESELELPDHVEVRKDRNSDLVVLRDTRSGDFIGVKWSSWDPSVLVELLERIA